MKTLLQYILRSFVLTVNSSWFKTIRIKGAYFKNYIYSAVITDSLARKSGPHFFEYPAVIKGADYITVGKNFSSRARLRIEAWNSYGGFSFNPEIIIGDNVNINFDCHIGAINRIVIGNNVLIGSRVLIIDHNHGDMKEFDSPPIDRPLFSKGPVIIEDNVWIGEGVAILPNVCIGRNSIIGANSVVTKDVPMNSIVSGVPAVLIKKFSV